MPKRTKSVKSTEFYESLATPVSSSAALDLSPDQMKSVRKFLIISLALLALLVSVAAARSVVISSTSQATPAGSIVIPGANANDTMLQVTRPTESFQGSSNTLQVQDNDSRIQAYGDAANLQGGTPSQ